MGKDFLQIGEKAVAISFSGKVSIGEVVSHKKVELARVAYLEYGIKQEDGEVHRYPFHNVFGETDLDDDNDENYSFQDIWLDNHDLSLEEAINKVRAELMIIVSESSPE